MFKSRIQFFIFILFISISFQNLNAQLSKKHYLPPITSDDNIENQYIYISTPKNQNIGFKIIPIGRPETAIINGTVSNTLPYNTSSTDIGDQLFQNPNSTSVVTNNKGYIIEADDVIYVSIRMRSQNGFQAGAIVSKGVSALGTNFRMGGFSNSSPANGYLNFVSVMATEDNTNITFDDISPGITINNYTQTGTTPINTILNEGETYIVSVSVSSGGDPNDLIGTLVSSDKPIVVNSGSATGSFHIGNGRDYGVDQIVDASKIGTEYIFVRGDGEDDWENILIVAHENNTEIKVGGNTVQTINKGQHHVIEGGFYNANGNMYVETSKPAFAYQGIGGLNNGSPSLANQGMFFVPPLSCENRGDVNNIANIDKVGSDTFQGGITIVTNKGAEVTINGFPIADFTTAGPFDVDGNSDYETYRVSGLNSNVTVKSTEELYCAYFNYDGFATSGGFYSGFPSAPEINFSADIASLGNCVPNLTLDAANTDLFDSFEWLFDDETGSGYTSTGITTPNFNPTEPGKYKLVGLINCSGLTFESAEVPVSLCPDDFDGDSVIDNIDIDIDNDGILNIDESLGNADIDISDLNNPQVFINSQVINNLIKSSSYSEEEASNSLTGDIRGNFESIINPATNSKLKYEINFNQNINFKFTQNPTIDHIVTNEEYFIIKIGPNNKNITLLDPDDQLLVDTNFDGVFETGVTNISASVIHFKYKNNTTGTESSFEFLANRVNQIDFKHQSNGITTTSTFNGNFTITAFTKDSDGDGIEDMLDIDSDNDGIPDIIETTNLNTALTGIDTDFNGLDDIFESTAVNQDSDNDGILNALDLDSDNDGIFDVIEAGHVALDSDLDGRIDDANTVNVGENGLLDSLETMADNETLSYTIADTDTDTNFNFLELDSDDDNCNDVTEAGFTDQNGNGLLGADPIQVNANGKVINTTDGYTAPNANYTTIAPITIDTPFIDVTFCESATEDIFIDTSADGFQWQTSTNNGSTWTDITNNTIYSGATSNTLKITQIPLNYNNHQFKVLLNRTGNSCQEESNSITLTVNPLPIIKTNPVILKQCDENADLTTTFNLTEAQISLSDNHVNETFQYFATEADAIAGTPLVADELRYPVTANGEAWARIISQFGCYEVSKIELIVSFAGNVAYNREFEECDDFLDINGNNTAANSDTDGISFFDFSEARQEVLDLFPALIQPNLEVNFYESIADRTALINEIPDISNHRNNSDSSFANNQTIYIRIKNTVNNDCTGIGELFLKVDSVPTENPVQDLEDCDNIDDGDSLNGIIQTFDLDSQTATILGSQNPANFTVTYHDSASNANTGNSPLTSPYTNTTRDLQTIYVRVTNNTTRCYTNHSTFNLIVSPVPVSNFVNDLEVCDDNTDGSARNGFSQTIDLESQTAVILGTQDSNRFEVTYHRTFNDAQSGNTPLVSPYTNSIPNRETIYIRVYDTNTMCQNGISNFDVIVNAEPTFENVSNLSYCDDDLDGDDTNGIKQTIDLDAQIPLLLGNLQDPDDFNVSFHSTQINATSGLDPLTSPYTNTNSTETIFVRIQNKATSCVNDDATFEVIINPLPDFNVTTPQILCLNDLPLNIYAENPNDIYSYEWRNLNGDLLGTKQDLDITSAGTYIVTATTTNGTNCPRTREIVINESNIATLENSFITIIDESNNIGNENNLSISINTTDNDLGPGDYQFAVLNNDNQDRFPSIGFQDEPLFENLEGGIYTIIVNDKNGCSPDTELLVSVIQFPKFFTPNGDSENDTWVIKGANQTFYPNSSINIFNRYGKLVAQVAINNQGWDGTYNGKVLSSDDYWFNITLIPADNTKPSINKKGHFSLLRK